MAWNMQANMMNMQQNMQAMQRQMQDDMGCMQREMQASMWASQCDMRAAHRDAQQEMQASMWASQRDMRAGHRDAQREVRQGQRRAQRDMRAAQRDAQREMRDAHMLAIQRFPRQQLPAQRIQNQRGQFPAGAVSTSVVNGSVYINGQWVAEVPDGAPVSIENRDGIVSLNGTAIWPPRAGARDQPQQAAAGAFEPRDRRRRDDPQSIALDSSRTGVSTKDYEEPCVVCLEAIRAGQQIRTLPCFHVFHRSCAEADFARDTRPNPVQCPMCRIEVAPVNAASFAAEVFVCD